MEPHDESNASQRATVTGPRRRGRLTTAITLAVVCALVAGFGALALLRQGAPALGPQWLVTASWRVYRDPLGLFTMRLPPGWTAASDIGWFTQGDRQGSDSGRDENIFFSDPALGAASASISVYAWQIHDTAFAQRMACSAGSRPTATFNGFPADGTMPPEAIFNTQNAHFQIDETIPGVFEPDSLGKYTPHPTPTPLPAATVTADRALLSDALASFQPTEPKPLACP